MPSVTVKNACSCFLKSGFPESQHFSDKDAAREEAAYLLEHMKNNFCKKHEFALSESFGNFTIHIRPRAR